MHQTYCYPTGAACQSICRGWALPAPPQVILIPMHSTTKLRELGGLAANLASKKQSKKRPFPCALQLAVLP